MINRELFSQSIEPAPSILSFDQNAVIFGFDTEFRSDTQQLICWQLAYEDKVKLYESPLSWESLREQAEKLSGKKLKCRGVFHFATFFSTAEAQHLSRLKTRFDQFYPGSYDVTHYLDPYRRLKLLDMAQWFAKQNLASACHLFGLHKMDYDVSNVMPKSLKDCKFREYALNDARIHRELFIRLRAHVWRLFQVDILKYRTAAAASLRHFRQSYITKTINNPCQALRSQALSTKHGGAMNNYFRGELAGKFYVYDAVSAYPQAVCALKVMPRAGDWRRVPTLERALSAKGGFLHVLFEFPPEVRYPCLIVKTASGAYYPLSGESFCTVAEARLAVKMGAHLHLVSGYVYNSGTRELSRYMGRLLKLRKKSQTPEENYLYKKFMNSLLGKFGQSYEKTSTADIEETAAAYEMTTEQFCSIAGFAESKVKRRLHLGAGYIPEWYALITGTARASVLEAAWRNNALAVVVDSFISPTSTLQTGDTYGGIRYTLKQTGIRYVAYREMFYALYDEDGIAAKIAHQGTPENSTVKNALFRFDPQARELHYKRKRIVKLQEAVRRGVRFGATIYENHSKPLYHPRGIITETGWVQPFDLAPR
jgi:hypothetical protein